MDLHTRSFSQLLYHQLCQHVINLSCFNFYFKQSFVVKFGGVFPSGFIFGKFLVILLKIWHINVQLTIFEYFTDKDPSSNQMPFYSKHLPAPHPTSCIHYVNKQPLYLNARTIKALRLAEVGHMSQQLHTPCPFGLRTVKENAQKTLTKWDTVKFTYKTHGRLVFSFLNKENLLTYWSYFNIHALRAWVAGGQNTCDKHSPYRQQCDFSLRSLWP